MRALVISDTHFGAWTGDDLLRRKTTLDLLAPNLDDIDEVILLGDLFDLMFSTVEEAFRAAEGFFDLLAEKMEGKRVVFLAGNHDHHIMVRELEQLVEQRLATGRPASEIGVGVRESNYLARFLQRRLPGTETEIVYPSYRFGGALLFHGHYLDAHMQGSLANRLLTKATWGMAGGRPQSPPSISDYEAVITPLTELLYSVAQLPRGATAQRSVYGQLEQLGRWLHLFSAPGREVERILGRITDEVRGLASARSRRPFAEIKRHARIRHAESARARRNAAGLEIARVVRPSEPVAGPLEAYAQVVRNLGWDAECDTMVFAHTHQPLNGVRASESDRVRYWNPGSWIYQPTMASVDDYIHYLEYAWPGTAVLIDTERDEPELVDVLGSYNPLAQHQPSAPERRVLYERARRSGTQIPGPLGPQPQPSEAPAPAARRAVVSMVRRRRLRGLAVFAVGLTAAMNLFGAVFPGVITRVHSLALLLPVGIAEGTRALLFVVAALLLVLTRGLWQGNRRAWTTALLLVTISGCLHLVRQGDLTGTGIALATVMLFALTARSFRVPGRTLAPGIPLLAVLTLFSVVLAYGLVGWAAVAGHLPHADMPDRAGTVLRAAFLFDPGIEAHDALGRGFLASLGLVGGISLIVLVSLALSSFAVSPKGRTRPDLHAFLARFGQTSTAPLVSARDNQVLDLVEGRALVGLKVVSGVAVVIGEPIGEPGTQLQALEELVERCEIYGWTPALFGVSQDTADRARKLGFEALKVSEEALIELPKLSLAGSATANLRQAVNRGRRNGVEVVAYEGAERTAQRDAELAEISRTWLRLKQGPELGFTLGRFDPDELDHTEPYVALWEDRIVGFVTWLSYREGHAAVIDMMRRLPDSPPGTMELLLYSCLEDFRDRGRTLASLGGVALASTTQRRGPIERGLGWLFDYGGSLYEAKGLFTFKQKFNPSWQPQYLVYPTTLDLPRIMVAVRRAYRHYAPAAPEPTDTPVTGELQPS